MYPFASFAVLGSRIVYYGQPAWHTVLHLDIRRSAWAMQTNIVCGMGVFLQHVHDPAPRASQHSCLYRWPSPIAFGQTAVTKKLAKLEEQGRRFEFKITIQYLSKIKDVSYFTSVHSQSVHTSVRSQSVCTMSMRAAGNINQNLQSDQSQVQASVTRMLQVVWKAERLAIPKSQVEFAIRKRQAVLVLAVSSG